jgi:hypothetical protein
MDIVERLRTVDISWSETGEWCAEAADEIERLRWENANMEKLWGKSEGTWMEIRDNQDAEIELLRKERDGLREVLQSIKKIPNSEAAYGVIQTFVDDALKEKE